MIGMQLRFKRGYLLPGGSVRRVKLENDAELGQSQIEFVLRGQGGSQVQMRREKIRPDNKSPLKIVFPRRRFPLSPPVERPTGSGPAKIRVWP